jgi:hypothetical protein
LLTAFVRGVRVVSSKHPSDVAGPTGTSNSKRRAVSRQPRQRVAQGDTASAVPPLQWWRRLPADAFTFEHLKVLRRAVAGIGMVGEPRWADAVRGHPATAVGLALDMMQERRPLAAIVDLTMSTVLIAALLASDKDAITVLVTMIERMGGAAEKEALTRSWQRQQRTSRRGRVAAFLAHPRSRSGA